MTKRHPLYLLAALLAVCFIVACNDDVSDVGTIEGDYNNCSISSFSLSEDDDILRALDSVYFSIDLINAEIYNADSLPKGTDVSRLIVNVSASSASSIELTFKSRFTSNDTTVNITTDPNDSINFATGPVRMTVTSYNGLSKRDYNVSVNVHKTDADTLYWDRLQQVSFPVNATEQKTVMYAGITYTLLAGTDGSYYMCTTENPETYSWMTKASSLPGNAVISSFASTDDAMYIADTQGHVYTSTDGLAWAATTAVMDCVYGGYKNILLGARRDSDGWKHVTYPASTEREVPSGCPVSGMSQLVLYETKWSTSPISVMVGGIDSAGRYTGEAWAYDGQIWDRISTTGIDERAGVTLVPYTTPRYVSDDSWRLTEQDAILAMGGIYESESGVVTSKKVYISYDLGITWKEADSYLQFPDDYPEFSSAQAYTISYTLSARSVSDDGNWIDITPRKIPCWATPVNVSSSLSRVSSEVTSWDCPYILLFGGIDSDGSLNQYVTRGVINRFTFQPLY